jgi:hypothetical protein
MFDGKIAGDEALKKKFSYDTEIPACRRRTATPCASA